MKIAVYQDYVHNNGSLLMALQTLGHDVLFVDAAAITQGELTQSKADALIMPGGADLYYCEKLNGAGNAAIRAFVEAGGGYLGICAGAYYGCSALDWDNNAIGGGRELGFVDAVATGPILQFIQNGDIKQSWYGAPSISWGDRRFKTLYAAGPVFENPQGDIDVLAQYDDLGGAPAVIGRRVGRGYAVLSSPHIEAFGDTFAAGRYAHNNANYAHEQNVAAQLQADIETQRDFFAFILKTLSR